MPAANRRPCQVPPSLAGNRPSIPTSDPMELALVTLLNGLVYGMLLFMLASGLTLIFSLMGVLNFAHASTYMIGAYLAFQISQMVGFWPALIVAPVLCGAIGAAIEIYGLRKAHRNGHIAELLFTFGVAFLVEKGVQMIWGLAPVPYRVPAELNFALFTIYGTNFPAYRGFMLLISMLMFLAIWLVITRTRIGLIIQASLTHPEMVGALGHNVPRVFTTVFAGGSALAGLAGVIGGNYLETEPAMAFTMGPIVFVVVVFGGLGSLTGCFIASLIMGFVQSFAVVFDVSLADLLGHLGVAVSPQNPFAEVLTVPLPRIAALLPFLLLIVILIFKPRGLMGTRDT
jgi:branched-chain amino acid transport system permease protein